MDQRGYGGPVIYRKLIVAAAPFAPLVQSNRPARDAVRDLVPTATFSSPSNASRARAALAFAVIHAGNPVAAYDTLAATVAAACQNMAVSTAMQTALRAAANGEDAVAAVKAADKRAAEPKRARLSSGCIADK